jgi:hypothetical protein
MKPEGFRTKEEPVKRRHEVTQIDTEQVKELTEKELAELGRLFLAKLQGKQSAR